MRNHLFPHFITVLGLHLALIFGGFTLVKKEEALSSLSTKNHTLRLQVATQRQRLEPKPEIRKITKTKSPVQDKKEPKPKKVSDEVVEKTIVSSAPTQEIEDIRSLYKAQLRAKIEENKYYPPMSRRLGQQGTVVVAFTLLKDGHIINVKVEDPSQFERLNASALEAVKKVKRFMPIPNELGMSRMDIKVPLKFFTI